MRPENTTPSRSFAARRAYAWLAVGVMGFAAYASLIPFELQSIPLERAWAEFLDVMRAPSLGRVSRTNLLANILMFVPIGFGLMGALLADGRRRLAIVPAALAVIPISIAVSLTVEFLQIFAPTRVTARHDVVAQTIGCVIGIAAWVGLGPALTLWLRAASDRSRGDRLARALTGYAAIWVFVNLAPFDIVLDPGTIAHRLRIGMVTLVPFGSVDGPAPRLLWSAFAAMISALPLGVLGVVGWSGRRARRSARAALGVGAALVGAVEAAQIFIRSHTADPADAIFGWSGVALGVWIGVTRLSPGRSLQSVHTGIRGPAIAALALWWLILCAYHWMPYDFTIDHAAIERKVAQISLIPFVEYQSGSDLQAFNELLVKLSLSVPVGLISAVAKRGRMRVPGALAAAWLILAACLFTVIEAGQLFLPTRTPGMTDVLVGVAGTALGLRMGRWLQQ